MLLLKSFVQEDEDDEYEEENSLMEDTMDQTGSEEVGDENDDRILIDKKTYQVSAFNKEVPTNCLFNH